MDLSPKPGVQLSRCFLCSEGDRHHLCPADEHSRRHDRVQDLVRERFRPHRRERSVTETPDGRGRQAGLRCAHTRSSMLPRHTLARHTKSGNLLARGVTRASYKGAFRLKSAGLQIRCLLQCFGPQLCISVAGRCRQGTKRCSSSASHSL